MDIKDFIDAHWLPIAKKENEVLAKYSLDNHKHTEEVSELEGLYYFEQTLFRMVNTIAQYRGLPALPAEYGTLEDLLTVFNYLVILAEKDLGTHATMTVLVARLIESKNKAKKQLN
jgi:hypothetical protein